LDKLLDSPSIGNTPNRDSDIGFASHAESSGNRTSETAYVTRTDRSGGPGQRGAIAGGRVGGALLITGETMRPLFNALLLALPLSLSSFVSAAESPAGRWQTIDDETGKPKSIVEIQQAADGTLTGKVAQILQSEHGPNPLCSECEGERKDQPITGMTILWDLKPDGEQVWSDGTILDPAKGKTYRSKARLLDGGDKLEVRGYIGIEALGRSQTWVRQ
jgi:uncharacterized protein (DUF2147 family)